MRVNSNSTDPDLKNEVIAVLLKGWDASPPSGVPPGPCGFSGGLLRCFDVGGPAELWLAHEAFLRDRAEAWGWTPEFVGPDGVRRFYAEALDAGMHV